MPTPWDGSKIERDKRAVVMLNETERNALITCAKHNRISVSKYIRRAVVNALVKDGYLQLNRETMKLENTRVLNEAELAKRSARYRARFGEGT